MSAPSTPHERRVATLECVAVLSGHPRCLRSLSDGSVPDVARVGDSGRRLFVGDAKASEPPGDAGSVRRLERYISSCAAASRSGADVTLAICCASESEAVGWLHTLTRLARGLPTPLAGSGVLVLSDTEALAWVTVPGAPAAGMSRHAALVPACA